MTVKEIHSDIDQVSSTNIQLINSDTTTQGTIVDLEKWYGLEYLVLTGIISSGQFNFILEHGNDSALADAEVVANDFILTSPGTVFVNIIITLSHTSFRFGYVGSKRYVRLSIVSSGGTNGTIGAEAVRNNPRRRT